MIATKKVVRRTTFMNLILQEVGLNMIATSPKILEEVNVPIAGIWTRRLDCNCMLAQHANIMLPQQGKEKQYQEAKFASGTLLGKDVLALPSCQMALG